METATGGCQCRRVRYEVRLRDTDAYFCHCDMCKRATGGVAAALKEVQKADVTWTASEPDWYASSPIARRPFCSACGSPLGFEYPESERMDLTVGSFDDPGRFTPTSHFSAETILEPWLHTADLKRMRLDEYQALQDKWKAAGVTPPA